MNTINLVLMCILCTMIGFAIGNIWGKETMKRTLSELLQKMIDGLNHATKSLEKADKENKKESGV